MHFFSLKFILHQVRVPTSCLPTAVMDNIISPDYSLDPSEDDASSTVPSGKCFYDGMFFCTFRDYFPPCVYFSLLFLLNCLRNDDFFPS